MGGPRGYDGNKKIVGRKRFTLTDTCGFVLCAVILPANTGERAGAKVLFGQAKALAACQSLQCVFADEGFEGVEFGKEVQREWGWRLEIVQKPEGQKGFEVLSWRWIIEQTFGCAGRYRCLHRDYERNTAHSLAVFLLANAQRLLNALHPKPATDEPFKYRKP